MSKEVPKAKMTEEAPITEKEAKSAYNEEKTRMRSVKISRTKNLKKLESSIQEFLELGKWTTRRWFGEDGNLSSREHR